jgi:serine phosphatase RsbU (regulator of sigma subunit)
MNENGEEFTGARLLEVVKRSRDLPARAIVDAIFEAVAQFRGQATPNDDMTAVALKITA